MRRRDLVALLGSTAIAWPLVARAQQPSQMRRIGVLRAMPIGTAKAHHFAHDFAHWTPLVGPNSIIPGLPEANAACKKEIGPRGGLFSRCENFFLSELDEPLLTEFSAGSLVSFSKDWWKNACLARSANRTAFISSRSIRPDTVRNSRWHYRKRQGTSVHAATPHHDPGIAVGTSTCKEPRG